MELIGALAQKLGVPAIWSGESAFFLPQDAIRVIDALDLRVAQVLGVEGIQVEGGILRPDLDAILDLSSLPGRTLVGRQCAVDEAKQFLSAAPDALRFEIVVSTDPLESG